MGLVTRAKQFHLTVSSPTLHTVLFDWMHFKIILELLKN